MMLFLSYEMLRFEPDPGITGFERSIVVDDGRVLVKFWRVPPGWGLAELGIVENLHFHRHAWEYAAFLRGDFPHVEYDGAAGAKTRIRFGAGDLMMRPPGSIHGLHADMRVESGCEILYWNTGPGTSVLDAEYLRETVDVAGDPAAYPYDPESRCRIGRRQELRRHAARGGVSEASVDGDPLRVELRWLATGECISVAELLGDDALFAFQWSGECLREGSDRLAAAVRKWTTLVGPAPVPESAERLRAATDACWLRVLPGSLCGR